MTRRARTALAGLSAIALAGALAIAAVLALRSGGSPGVPPELVPASWARYRTSVGHEAHLATGKVACRDCHDYERPPNDADPNDQGAARSGFRDPGSAPCGRCHEKQAAHGHAGGAEKVACTECHVFGPDRATPTCKGCHAQDQPGPERAGSRTLEESGPERAGSRTLEESGPELAGSRTLEESGPEQERGALTAIRQHATTNCASCHRVHEDPAIVPAPCADCHDERALRHADHPESKGCLDCHRAHAPAKDAAAVAACQSCHTQPAGPRPAGHDACVGCHRPHDFTAGGERACIGCHGLKPTLAAGQVSSHAVCTGCHAPHAATEAAASCRGCHATIALSHGGRTACVDCHEPHTAYPAVIVSRCTTCHGAIAASDTSAHAGGTSCTSCHKPHEFDRSASGALLSDAVRALRAPGSRTLEESGPERKRGALCATCHARELSLTSAAQTPTSTANGHGDCAACHGQNLAHAPAAPPSCGTCHAKEQASAPAGHAKCDRCHEPHAASVRPEATCASCHADRTAGPHAAIPGGCETCHRPHGPGGVAAPPSCTSCHVRSTLPALHAAAGHADCAACHTSSHGPPHGERATCTGAGCHADRRGHQPAAPVCTGCHVFRR
jgi:hypothetical protein